MHESISKKGTWASTPGSKSPFTFVGFDYFRNRCHGGDRDLHDYRDCSRVLLVVDQPNTIGSLPLTVARDMGIHGKL